MSLLFGDDPKTLNLLSIGERGVGKTVFLVGSYTESNHRYEGDQPKNDGLTVTITVLIKISKGS